jgi:FKBP-type peptidyl-prolyl cis-trans isomerase
MRRISMVLILVCAVFWGCGKSGDTNRGTGQTRKLDTFKRKASYASGYDMAKNFKKVIAETDLEYFIQGLRDAVNDVPLPISEEENEEIIRQFKKDIARAQREQKQQLAEKNKVEGETFLKENAKREGVKVTQSGLQYMVIKEGQGAKPTLSDMVKIHFTGIFVDGKEFDSSQKRGGPLSVDLRRCIDGWKEGMQLMGVGAKYRFFIPSELAYDRRGFGDRIGANAVLIYEIELLDVKPIPGSRE